MIPKEVKENGYDEFPKHLTVNNKTYSPPFYQSKEKKRPTFSVLLLLLLSSCHHHRLSPVKNKENKLCCSQL